MTDRTEEVTFETLCELEPRLRNLEREIIAARRYAKSATKANWVWYDRFKDQLTYLVDWESSVEALQTIEAYDVAYEYLYDLLSRRVIKKK